MTEQQNNLMRLITVNLDLDIKVIKLDSNISKIFVKSGLEEQVLVVYYKNADIKEMFCSNILSVCNDIIDVLNLSASDLKVELE